MKVTRDKYEFPIYIAETQKELAMLCGVNKGSISRAIGEARRNGYRCCYVRVDIEEDE